MGVQPLPPYLFPPSRQAESNPTYDFDPKAVTRASYAASLPKPKKPNQDGPLLDFNRHPDSWTQAPYGQVDVEPMDPRTRTAVKWTRWAQMALRVLQEIGALGALFLVITLKGMLDSQAWIVRVPVSSRLPKSRRVSNTSLASSRYPDIRVCHHPSCSPAAGSYARKLSKLSLLCSCHRSWAPPFLLLHNGSSTHKCSRSTRCRRPLENLVFCGNHDEFDPGVDMAIIACIGLLAPHFIRLGHLLGTGLSKDFLDATGHESA